MVGVGDHVVPLDDLLAFASFGFAECTFSSIEFMPAAPGCVGNIFVGQELDHGVFLGLGSRGESAVFPVSEEHFGGFLGIALGVADESDRSALDPARGVKPGDDGTVLVKYVSAIVGDNCAFSIEGNAPNGVGAVAHSAVDGLDRPIRVLSGAAHAPVSVEFGAFGSYSHHMAVFAEDFHGGFEEVDVELVGCAFGVADGVLFEHVAHQVLRFGGASCLFGSIVVDDVFGVDDYFDGGGVVKFLELQWREFRLSWAAPTKHMHFLSLVVFEALVHVVGDFGDVEFVAGFGEDAGHVKANVADAHNGHGLGGQIPRALEVGVAVVKSHEFPCAERAFEVRAGNV